MPAPDRRRRARASPRCVAASRIGVGTGARLLVETFPARLERGAGLPAIERVGYLAEHVEAQLAGVEHLILAGTRAPVSFFAYPGRPSDLVPDGCTVHVLARGSDDAVDALERLADAGRTRVPSRSCRSLPCPRCRAAS